MKKLNFGTKLLLILVSITVISLGLMIYVVSSYSYSNSRSDAQNYINELAKKNALEIKILHLVNLFITKKIFIYIFAKIFVEL